MADRGLMIENAEYADVPNILRLFNDFENLIEKTLNLTNYSSAVAENISVFTRDFTEKKFQCQLLKSENGDFFGLAIISIDHLAGVGPILLLTLLYAKEQRKGLGKFLLVSAIKEAENLGKCRIKQIHFLVNAENHSAWEFYKRLDSWNLSKDTGFIVYQLRLASEVNNKGNENVIVRAAEFADLSQVVELFKDLKEKYSVPIWAKVNIQEANANWLDNVYVAEHIKEDGSSEILGIVSFYFRYGMLSNYTPFIVGFLVKDGWRRSGIGTTLIKHLSQIWVSQNSCVYANVLLPKDESSAGRRFFSRFPDTVNRTEEDSWNYCLFDRPSHWLM